MASANRLIELFDEARSRAAGAERDQFVSAACSNESELKEQVLSLLQAHESAGDFLKHSDFSSSTAGLTEKPGDTIGGYKLLQKIGEGGCGVVYLAAQEEPMRRQVALKIIKLGMDTRSVIARFEAERQTLAMMDHPNIAKILDAGATGTGRPYFVMELVRGIRITEYCDQNHLSTSERLELFIQVCQAIQHAHQKGIIHRDIKPSNILVTQNESVPAPKVIDFGIAKATTDQRLTDKTIFTAFEQFIGTPAYMSPEQAKMTSLDIDTRTDIYALGVLLYELLTGQTPFDAKELMAAGLDAMRRIIREEEPARPSTKLSQTLAAEVSPLKTPSGKLATEEEVRAGSRRLLRLKETIPLLRGDLDWIVMKALEKDRTRRYETANGLAADIQRHLNNEPVEARPPSRWYEFQKSVQRHKFGFAAAAALILVLAIGVFASTWQALRATRAESEQTRLRKQAENARNNEARERAKAEANEQKAELEAARSQQVAQFMKDMLAGVGPSVALGRDTALLREILDKTAARIAEDLKQQPEVEAELRSAIGTVYYELGDFEKAAEMHRRALAIHRQRHGNQNANAAADLLKLGETLRQQHNLPEAEAALRESLAMRRSLLGNQHPDVVHSLNELGSLLSIELNNDEPDALLREALATGQKLFGDDHPYVATSLDNLGHVLNRRGNAEDAATLHLQALAIRKKLYGSTHPELIYSYLNLAQALEAQAKPGEAETMIREALSICDRLLGQRHPTIPLLRSELNRVLATQGKSEDSPTPYSEFTAKDVATSSAETARPPGDGSRAEKSSIAVSLQTRGVALQKEGKLTEAEPLLREAITLFKELLNDKPSRVEHAVQLGHTQWQLGSLFTAADQPRKAEDVLRESLRVFEQATRDFPADRFLRQEQAFNHRLLGNVLDLSERLDEIERLYRASIAIYIALKAEVPDHVLYAREAAYTTWVLALKLDSAGRTSVAAAEFGKAIALYEQAVVDFPNQPDLKSALAEILRQRRLPGR
ncbi:MAG: protein kinase domain-containing protein [Limisphaerales bacterium]